MRISTTSTSNWYQSYAMFNDWADGQANLMWASGYWTVAGIDTGTTTPNDQDLKAVPIYVNQRITIDRLGIYVTTAASAGGVARAGIYSVNATTGLPGALYLNGGSNVATTNTGEVVTWTVSTTLEVGIYWLACLFHGAPSTKAIVQSYTRIPFTIHVPSASSATAFSTAVTGLTKASAGTSLPDPFGTPTTYGGNGVRIGLRLA